MLPKIPKKSKRSDRNSNKFLNRYKSQIIRQPRNQFQFQRSFSRPRFEFRKSSLKKNKKIKNKSIDLKKGENIPTNSSKRSIKEMKGRRSKKGTPLKRRLSIKKSQQLKPDFRKKKKINILHKINKKLKKKDNDLLEMKSRENFLKFVEEKNSEGMKRKKKILKLSYDESQSRKVFLKNKFRRSSNSMNHQSQFLSLSQLRKSNIQEPSGLNKAQKSYEYKSGSVTLDMGKHRRKSFLLRSPFQKKSKQQMISEKSSSFKKKSKRKNSISVNNSRISKMLEIQTELKIDTTLINKPKSRKKREVFTGVSSRLMAGFKQGMIKTNQDNIFINTNILKDGNSVLLGVFDGHGVHGHYVSKFLIENLKGKIFSLNKIFRYILRNFSWDEEQFTTI